MVSEKKIQTAKEVGGFVEKYPVVGILNMYKLPSRQLHSIKEKLKGKAKVRVLKKKLLERVLKEAKRKGISNLEVYIREQPAFLFSETNPFELARLLSAAKSKATAKAGDIAPTDITVPAGPTSLPAGPAISELQKAGLPAGVEGGKVAIKKDTVIVKEGQKISKEVADVLGKLGIEPMEIGLDLLAVWDNGTIYGKDILFVPQEKYIEELKLAYLKALNLSVNAGFVTKENADIIIADHYRKALNLAVNAGVVNGETVSIILARAHNQAQYISGLVK